MQQLIVIFEIVLLVAIVAGAVFVCWTPPSDEERQRLRNRGQNSI